MQEVWGELVQTRTVNIPSDQSSSNTHAHNTFFKKKTEMNFILLAPPSMHNPKDLSVCRDLLIQACDDIGVPATIVEGASIETPSSQELGFGEAIESACCGMSCFLVNNNAHLGLSAVRRLVQAAPATAKPVVFILQADDSAAVSCEALCGSTILHMHEGLTANVLRDFSRFLLEQGCAVNTGTKQELHFAMLKSALSLRSPVFSRGR